MYTLNGCTIKYTLPLSPVPSKSTNVSGKLFLTVVPILTRHYYSVTNHHKYLLLSGQFVSNSPEIVPEVMPMYFPVKVLVGETIFEVQA